MPIKLSSLHHSTARLTFLNCASGSLTPPLRTLHGFSSISNWRPTLHGFQDPDEFLTSPSYSLFLSQSVLTTLILAILWMYHAWSYLQSRTHCSSSPWNVFPWDIFLIPSPLVLPDVYSNIFDQRSPLCSPYQHYSASPWIFFSLIYYSIPDILCICLLSFSLAPNSATTL